MCMHYNFEIVIAELAGDFLNLMGYLLWVSEADKHLFVEVSHNSETSSTEQIIILLHLQFVF
jgi:hypothetical protein